jgi:hypothetical protein
MKKLHKAEKFTQFLEEKELKCFQKEEIKDELETVVFRSFMEIEGQNLPVVIILDRSIYTVVRVQIIAKVAKKYNPEKMLEYINEMNRQYKVFKYYVTEEGDLYLDSCIPSNTENFDGELVYTVIDVILKHLTEHYTNFMKKLWSIDQ